MMMRFFVLPGVLLVAALAGCSTNTPAPILERGTNARPAPVVRGGNDARPQTYVVQKGDTLYSIALNNGLDYHDVAALNNIQDPAAIQVGQELRLSPPETAVVGKVVSVPPPVTMPLPGAEIKPIETAPIETQPQIVKLPWSDTAMAQIEQMQAAQTLPEIKPAPPAAPVPPPAPVPVAAPVAASAPTPPAAPGSDDIDWGLPVDRKAISGFSESDNHKGIDFNGRMGQAVLASAAGKVVYSGSGLPGYGKLLIVKHNNTWLSVYANNSQILVKEGDTVAKGQKIAEMGNSNADRVKLHFEIRKFGQPVSPLGYLPKL